jgi:hypothetical protein
MATPYNIPGQLRSFKFVYAAMAIVQLVFGGVVYGLLSTGMLGVPDYTLALTFQKIALIFIPLAMAVGYFLFRYLVTRIDPKLPLDDRLKRYFSVTLVRAALFEVAFFYCCVAALVTHVSLFLWITPIIFLLFLIMRPSPEAIATDLHLSPDDSSKLDPRP